MGQAGATVPVDLPDPKSSAAPESLASADDLLAQLAGDEIERLLAEDGGAPATAPAPASEPGADIDSVLTAAQKSSPALAPESKIQPLSPLLPTSLRSEVQSEEESTDAEMRQLLNDQTVGQKPDRLPIHLRALMFLNAPFANLSDNARESIGKIAVLTLFNSIAVLLYVLIFRRHH